MRGNLGKLNGQLGGTVKEFKPAENRTLAEHCMIFEYFSLVNKPTAFIIQCFLPV